jgi:hypothetical protein
MVILKNLVIGNLTIKNRNKKYFPDFVKNIPKGSRANHRVNGEYFKNKKKCFIQTKMHCKVHIYNKISPSNRIRSNFNLSMNIG